MTPQDDESIEAHKGQVNNVIGTTRANNAEARRLPPEKVAEILGHPIGGRKTDPQLSLAVSIGHLGRRLSHAPTVAPPNAGSLTDGLPKAQRAHAARRGLWALAQHVLGIARPIPPVSRTWRLPRAWQLDQGDTPQCVAYTKAHWNLSLPVANRTPVPAADYLRAKQLDGYPTEEGTDAATMLRVATEQGEVASAWWWTGPEDTEALDEWLLTVGPVWLGANWSEGMFRTDQKGFINPTGEFQYGHETLLVGSDRRGKTRTILNSWGRANWGIEGRGKIRDEGFARLMSEGLGDIVGVVEKVRVT